MRDTLLPLICLQLGNLARNPGMCPDWESNWRPFNFQASTQSTEPYQPVPKGSFLMKLPKPPRGSNKMVFGITIWASMTLKLTMSTPFPMHKDRARDEGRSSGSQTEVRHN